MKLLTTNFLTCAVKTCKTSPASFPLHPQSATLSRTPLPFSAPFILNILPRLHYSALTTLATELSLQALLPSQEKVEGLMERVAAGEEVDVESEETGEVLRGLHGLLLETGIQDGRLVCGECGFEYPVKEGVGNFLLPSHLV
jgi:multifunctional methyltransferase subunit TRM112